MIVTQNLSVQMLLFKNYALFLKYSETDFYRQQN